MMAPIAEAADADAAQTEPAKSWSSRWRRSGLALVLAVTSCAFTLNNQKTLNEIRSFLTSTGPITVEIPPALAIERNNASLLASAGFTSSKIRGNNATAAQASNSTSIPSVAAADKDNEEESFSACLLIMDDNHRLVEWLAYHYFALNLRHLVVAVDPHSRTNPDPILDRWRTRMTIEVWSDSNFTSANLMINSTVDTPVQMTGKHRKRQNGFYLQCIKHLQKAGRKWTSFHDVDEFLTINGHVIQHSDALVGRPGSVLQMVQKYSATNNNMNNNVTNPFWYEHFQQSGCVTVARQLYSAKESTHEKISRGFPPALEGEFDVRRFDTLRYRYRVGGNFNGCGKSIIDVSRVKPEDFKGGASAHKPLKSLCPNPWISYNRLPLGIHHYLGSFEAYSFREDARKGSIRTYEVWKERSMMADGGADDIIRPWIAGFVKLIGEEEAKQLLRDAGLPPDYKKSQEEILTWVKMPEK